MNDLRTTFQYIKKDFNRRLELDCSERKGVLNKLSLFVKPGFQGVLCFRLSHYFAETKLSFFCRILHTFSFFYARVEIDPRAQIGPGLVCGDIGGIGLPAETIIGENCTFLGFNTLTLNKISGVDFTVDRIIMGNHCVLGVRSKVMRPITIADGAQIKDNSVVMFSVANVGTTLAGVPAKKRRIDDYNEIVKWNPLVGGPINKVSR